MSTSIKQLITRLRAVGIDEPDVLKREISRIDGIAVSDGVDTKTLAACVSELIYIRHQGHPLQDKYSNLCECLFERAENEGDTGAREIALLGAELLCGSVTRVGGGGDTIAAACVNILDGDWTAGVQRVDDVLHWLETGSDDPVVVMHCVRVLKWVGGDDVKWRREELLNEWMQRYTSNEMFAIGVVCELVDNVEEAAEMVQLCVKRNDSVGRRWFLKKLAEFAANIGGVSANLVMGKIDWRYLIKAGDVDLAFGVLKEVVDWTPNEGVELVRVLLHCATLSGKRKQVWDVIILVLSSGVPEEILCKALIVFARTGGDVGILRVEKLSEIVMKSGSDVRRILAQLAEKGSCEAFLQLYVLVNREWGSREYTSAVKRYPGCSSVTKMLMIDWFNDGGFELEEEVGILRERVREATINRHKVLGLPPIADYVRMLKYDVGIIEVGGVKVKFKVRREGFKCELELRWSADEDVNAHLRTFGDSYNVEETHTDKSMSIVIKIGKLYPEWEEPNLVLNDEEFRLPVGLKTMRAQGMPLPVFEKRWSVLRESVRIEGINGEKIDKMGVANDGNIWCCLIYTESEVVGVLGRGDEVKCTKYEDFVVSRLRRVCK